MFCEICGGFHIRRIDDGAGNYKKYWCEDCGALACLHGYPATWGWLAPNNRVELSSKVVRREG